MRKFVILGLSFILVFSSVALVFADGGSPVILPVASADDTSTGFMVNTSDGLRYYRASASPVYLAFYGSDLSSVYAIYFSDSPSTIVSWNYSNSGGYHTDRELINYYNGYYFVTSSPVSIDDSIAYIGDFASASDVIDYVNSSVFSTTFSLTYLLDGSLSWLSSMAQAVLNNGLLLFFILIIFVGVGVGLFRRFI